MYRGGLLTASLRPTLFIFSGLPATGKTSLAKRLAGDLQAAYLRIDTVEQALRDICNVSVEGEGYRLSYRIAADNLRVGVSVVADSCNPIELTRAEWQDVARQAKAEYVNIETTCSDTSEHRARVEGRQTDIGGLSLPSWEDIQNREFDSWAADRVLIDTGGRGVEESYCELVSALRR